MERDLQKGMNTGRHSLFKDHPKSPVTQRALKHDTYIFFFFFLIPMDIFTNHFSRHPFLQSCQFFFLVGLLISQAICPAYVFVYILTSWHLLFIHKVDGHLKLCPIFFIAFFQGHSWIGLWYSTSLLLAFIHMLSYPISEPGVMFVLLCQVAISGPLCGHRYELRERWQHNISRWYGSLGYLHMCFTHVFWPYWCSNMDHYFCLIMNHCLACPAFQFADLADASL